MPTEVDPKQAGKKPPFHEPDQGPPGKTREMAHKPDHGEQSYRGFGRMEGKVALITGGDSGIGRAVAIAFAREGADVALAYLPQEEEEARETEHWVKDAGRRALLLPGSITEEQHCREIVERTARELGGLDVLVNNAAYQMTHDSLDEFSSEEWDHTFHVNIYAMFWLAKAALPRMKSGATIINVASVQAYKPTGKLLAYAATKGAIVTFTKALSQLTMERGVRVNAVAPGPVWTPLIPTTMPDEKVKNFGGDSEYGRPAEPAEMAPAFVYLATDESRYVTASVMDLTGGKMLP